MFLTASVHCFSCFKYCMHWSYESLPRGKKHILVRFPFLHSQTMQLFLFLLFLHVTTEANRHFLDGKLRLMEHSLETGSHRSKIAHGNLLLLSHDF